MAASVQTEQNLKECAVVSAEMFVPGISNEKVKDMYKDWAVGYDRMVKGDDAGSNWGAYKAAARGLSEVFTTNRDKVQILDVGAGTGLAAEKLKEAGFVTMDALDPSPEMLALAKGKNLYRNLYECYMTAEPTQFAANSYDAIVMSGAMHHGALQCDSFEEMTRIVKPGGYIVNSVRESFLEEVPEYKRDWTPMVKRLEKEGKWRVVKLEPYPNHYFGKVGLLTVFQVL